MATEDSWVVSKTQLYGNVWHIFGLLCSFGWTVESALRAAGRCSLTPVRLVPVRLNAVGGAHNATGLWAADAKTKPVGVQESASSFITIICHVTLVQSAVVLEARQVPALPSSHHQNTLITSAETTLSRLLSSNEDINDWTGRFSYNTTFWFAKSLTFFPH